MAAIRADAVVETSETIGTGDLELQGTLSGYRTFDSVCADGDTFCYLIRPVVGGDEFEIGDGAYDADTNSVQRTSVIASSNNNALVPFGQGEKYVELYRSAKRMAWKTGEFTSGRVPFANTDGDLTDTTEFQWDNTNKRLVITVEDAATTTASTVFTVSHNSTGTPGTGFGTLFLFQLETTTTTGQEAAAIEASWSSATHALRNGRMIFYVWDVATQTECLRLRAGISEFTGQVVVTRTTTETSATSSPLAAVHNTSGTPAAGFGCTIDIYAESTTTEAQQVGKIAGVWVTATHASRASDLILYAYYTTTAREGVRIRGTSSDTQIGFLGATPVSVQGSTTDLKNVLVNFGFLTDGGATPLNTDDGAITAGDINATTLVVTETDAVTNTTTTIATLNHLSSGTPAANFGGTLDLRLESTTSDRLAGQIVWYWSTATDASRAASVQLYASDSGGARNFLEGRASGSAAMIGFLGATPIVRPSSTGETTGHTVGGATAVRDGSTFTGNTGSTAYTISDIVKHLKNLGLLTS